jgi:hypothetical protein
MYYHAYLATRLAQAAAASLRAASHARPTALWRHVRFGARPTLGARPVAVNSYPRLCGLPVTVERLPIGPDDRAECDESANRSLGP